MTTQNDIDTIRDMPTEGFVEYLKGQDVDKRVWLAALKRWADTQDTDAFMKNWSALFHAGNKCAWQFCEELLAERRQNQSRELTAEEKNYMGLTLEE